MIFLALIQESLSVISLRSKSDALSLMVTMVGGGAGGVGSGAVGSKDEYPRAEVAELTLGCARGMKMGSGDLVVDMLRTLSGARDAPLMKRDPATETLPPWIHSLCG